MSSALEHSSSLRAPDSAATPADSNIEVVFCCDGSYFQHLTVAIVSLLHNNSDLRISIHIIATEFPAADREKLERSLRGYVNYSLSYYRFSIQQYAHFYISRHVTLATYLRIFICETLPRSIEKVLYLDCDLVVTDRIAELWKLDLGDHCVAAVNDVISRRRAAALRMPPHEPYINAGVLLLNLREWRRRQLSAQLVRFIEEQGNELEFYDQDALNAVCCGSVLAIDFRWNFQANMFRITRRQAGPFFDAVCSQRTSPAIVHYSTGDKPWFFMSIIPKKSLYYDYLKKTEWRDFTPIGKKRVAIVKYCIRKIMPTFYDYIHNVMHRSKALQ